MPLWSEKMPEVISILLNSVRLVLDPSMSSILENIPCALEMCILLFLDVMSSSIVLFRISVALLIFCLKDMSIDVSGVLKSPTIIVFLSISPFMSVSICFMYVGAPILGAYMLMSIISSSCLILLSLYSGLLSLFFFNSLCFSLFCLI